MKIMKVMYWNPMFDQMESWSIGDKFVSDWINGNVTDIYKRQNGEMQIEVNGTIAMALYPHIVQRIYYGEE